MGGYCYYPHCINEETKVRDINDLPKRLLMEGATPVGLGSPGGLLGGSSK